MENRENSTSKSSNVLQNTAEHGSNAECSVLSEFDKSNSIGNSPVNTEMLKELCVNSMEVDDCMVVKTPDVNITNFDDDDVNYVSVCKPTAFGKKHKSCVNNESVMFENVLLTDDSQMEVTQNSVRLSRFQKRKRLLSSYNDDSFEMNISNSSGIDSTEVSMIAPKFQHKKKNICQSINYSLFSADGTVITDSDDSNVSQVNKNAIFKKPLDLSVFESDSSSVTNVFKTEVPAFKLTKRNIVIADTTAFDNAINDSSMMSVITSPKNKTLNNVSTASVQEILKCESTVSTHKFSAKKIDLVDDGAFDNAINDSSMVSVITSPKNKTLNNVSTASVQEISKCESTVSTHKFTAKKIHVVDDGAFDNAINDSSMMFNIMSPKNKTLNNISTTSVQEISKCDTISENVSGLNCTYDVPVKLNCSQLKLSQNAKNKNESRNVSAIEPNNESYTLKNDSPSNESNCNASLSLDRAKNTLSDTYIVGNDINDTFSKRYSLKSIDKSTVSLTDVSCAHSQPSLRKPNFARKLLLNEVSQNFTFTDDDLDTTDDDGVNTSKNIESNKFKLKKTYREADSQIFENIIASGQEMDVSTTSCSKNNLSSKASSKSLCNDLSNVLLESKSEQNMNVMTDKSLTQQSSGLVLDAITENDMNMSSKSILLKYNTPNSVRRISGMFNFGRKSSRRSSSFQEQNDNCPKVQQHSVSFDIARNNSKNSFHNTPSNTYAQSYSEISTIPENDTHTIDAPIVSLSPVLESASMSNVSRKELKKTFSASDSINSRSDNEGLTLLNSTLESLDVDQSKRHSRSLTSRQSTSFNSSTKSLRSRNSSSSSSESSDPSTHSEMSINDDGLSLNSSVKSSENGRSSSQSVSSINITNASNISNVSTTSLKPKSATTINEVSTSIHGLLEDSGLSLKNTSECSEQNLLCTNQSRMSNSVKLEDKTTNISKKSIHSPNQEDNPNSISRRPSKTEGSLRLKNTSVLSKQNKSLLNSSKQPVVIEDETGNDHNDSRISSRSSTRLNQSTKNIKPEVLNISCGPSGNEESSKNMSAFLKQKDLLLNRSQKSTSVGLENETKNDDYNSIVSLGSSTRKTQSVIDVYCENENSLKLQNASFSERKTSSLNRSLQLDSVAIKKETKFDNNSRISTRSSVRLNHSAQNIKPEVPNINHGPSGNKESIKNSTTLLKQQDLSSNQLQKSTTICLENETENNYNSRVSTYSTSGLNNTANLELETFHATDVLVENEMSSKQSELLLNKSKISTSLENDANDLAVVERLSTRSNSLIDNRKPEASNSNIDGHFLENEKLPQSNNSSVTSSNQHKKCSPILEDETNDTSRISTRSSKRKKYSVNEFEPNVSVPADNSKQNKSSRKNSTRVTRSTSLSGCIRKPSLPLIENNDLSKSINNMSDGSVRHPTNLAYFNNDNVVDETLCTHFSSSLSVAARYSDTGVDNDTVARNNRSNVVDLSNENVDNESDDSMFWTTLDESSTQKSNVQTSIRADKVRRSNRVNGFQTPTARLSIAECVADKIGSMSRSRRNLAHPGAFELLDPVCAPPTTTSVQSPSILSKVCAKTDKRLDVSSNASESVFDQSLVELTVKEKFKSLYNKEQWITKRLYKFVIGKLQPKYDIYAVKYAEKFVKYLALVLNDDLLNNKVDVQLYTDMLRYHMARYDLIKDTFDYVIFLTDYIPRPYYDKLMPGWNMEMSAVKFDLSKNYLPIMEDEEFLRQVLENLNK